jgi:hypothetical protein
MGHAPVTHQRDVRVLAGPIAGRGWGQRGGFLSHQDPQARSNGRGQRRYVVSALGFAKSVVSLVQYFGCQLRRDGTIICPWHTSRQ